jgi:hypothetical protein
LLVANRMPPVGGNRINSWSPRDALATVGKID